MKKTFNDAVIDSSVKAVLQQQTQEMIGAGVDPNTARDIERLNVDVMRNLPPLSKKFIRDLMKLK